MAVPQCRGEDQHTVGSSSKALIHSLVQNFAKKFFIFLFLKLNCDVIANLSLLSYVQKM